MARRVLQDARALDVEGVKSHEDPSNAAVTRAQSGGEPLKPSGSDTRDVRVRAGRSTDAEGIERVARESWHAVYDAALGVETVDRLLGEWYDIDRLRALLDDDRPFLVAVEGGTVLGFATGHAVDGRGSLDRLYVHPDRWRTGVGTALLARLLDALPDASTVDAEVLAANEDGLAFYRACGFTERRRRDSTVPDHDFEVVEITTPVERLRARLDERTT